MFGFGEARIERGLGVLRGELTKFTGDGLTNLESDLENGKFKRHDWNGCPLSYAKGHAGSAGEDSNGIRTNDFTVAWDWGFRRIQAEEILFAVRAEIAFRKMQTEEKEAREEILVP